VIPFAAEAVLVEISQLLSVCGRGETGEFDEIPNQVRLIAISTVQGYLAPVRSGAFSCQVGGSLES
jgi:hypothetical protein